MRVIQDESTVEMVSTALQRNLGDEMPSLVNAMPNLRGILGNDFLCDRDSRGTRHYFWTWHHFCESREKNATYVCHALRISISDSIFFEEVQKSGAVLSHESRFKIPNQK